ncbi:MAG: hypothetical protein KAG10_00080 [Methylococcales bacterium]|nr:hypothetical protein [Methylococcales bacterium]MCK5924269.1 hypothetical protein [Methylococcales bacterium]
MKFTHVLFIVLLFLTQLTLASPLNHEKVPDALKPWVDWVLQDQKDHKCPFFNENYQNKYCAWPSVLSLDLTSKYGTFNSRWRVYSDSWVTLPGSEKHWPLSVTVNDQRVLVIKRQNKPMIKLSKGLYAIKGNLLWDAIPENLSIPADSGLVTLTINGKNIAYPEIKEDSLWLKGGDRAQNTLKNIQNKLDIQVFRQINDDIPLQLITYLELEVSGQQREIKLPHALLKGFIPTRLQSELPARIESNGHLLIQVRPGRWHIELHARHPKSLTTLALNIKDKSWPDSEIWVFKAQPYQRVVEIQNLLPIDPSQTNLSTRWKKYPAYQVNQGDVMKFNVMQRGDPEPEPNKLQLQRELWLDFDGKGYTIQDQINGKMSHGWRLDALPELQLGQVKLNDKNQLITQLKNSKYQGVEVRKGALILEADSRFIGDINHLSAVGWQHKFHHVTAELNLPPGWRLLAASGVDNVPDSWVSHWTLLDLFLVLIASLAIGRLWNFKWGLFALFTLVLIWHETNAPQYIWLNIIVAIALIKLLPIGLFLSMVRIYRNLCWLVLIIIIIPFLVDEVRKGLYPQLENPWKEITQNNYANSLGVVPKMKPKANLSDEESLNLAIPEAPPVIEQKRVKKILKSKSLIYSKQSVNYNRIDPNAVVQTGLGAPQWHWNTVKLSWNGSVDSEQQLNLWLLTPTMTLFLNFMRVICVVILSLLMLGLAQKLRFKLTGFNPLILCLGVLLLSGLPTQTLLAQSSADYPQKELLDELKERLLEAPECAPDCAEISYMKLTIDDEKMQIQLEVHANKMVAIPLPANYKQWFPNEVRIDGQVAEALLRDEAGLLWINLTAGIHLVELSGVNPIHKKFTLPLPLKPHYVKLSATHWKIEGLNEHGISENQLQFSRLQTNALSPESQTLEQGVLPPFIQVERILELGLDWRLKTRITRLINNEAAVVLELPLLKGESVTTPNIRVKKNKVQVNMSVNSEEFEWESILEKSSLIELKASETKRWTEVWKLDASPIWHIDTKGIAVVHHQDSQGYWLPEWRPWPGEKINLSIIRPRAIRGRSLTIDSSKLRITPGQRSQEVLLTLALRSSKGIQHTLILPNNAELQSVLVNGATQPIRQKGRKLTLPIKPGKQQLQIAWQQNTGFNIFFKSPEINLGLDSVNSHIEVNLGVDRWVLFTTGPRFGPAVLFWGTLFVIVFISIGLGKIRWTPLKHWQWFLLLVGLSQVPVFAALVVVAWLMALGVRAERLHYEYKYFNAVQVGLGLLSVVSLILLFVTVKQGLLGSPDMQIAGNQSSTYGLKWYQDRSFEVLPTATIISFPLLVYRLLMLMWSLWLAVSLLNWLQWGWHCFATNALWRKRTTLTKDSLPK